MGSNFLTLGIRLSGNISADSTLMFSDIFNLFPEGFQNINSHFENDYRLLFYPDSGFSEEENNKKLRHQTMSGYADDMIDFLEENNIKNIVYVAHSVNALLAFTAANKAPHLFSKIIVVSAMPFLLHDAETLCPCGFHSFNLDMLFDCIMQKQTVTQPKQAVQFLDILSNAFVHKTLPESKAVFQLLFTTDCRNYLTDFTVPTVILQVIGDRIATNEAGYYMYRSIPNSQFVRIKAKGQLPFCESPEEITKAIKLFIHSTSF